jgi:AcrR family transcriptional regulator
MGPVITRAEILEVAARVIGRYGFDRASLRLIASEANVSYGTVQHHFKTKDLIWEALVDEVMVPAWTRRINVTPDQVGPLLSRFVARRLEAAILRPGLSGAVLTDSMPANDERLRYLAKATSDLRQRNRQILVDLRDQGALRNIDVDAFRAVAVVGLGCLSSAKTAIRELIGVDMDDESQRNKLVEGITDLLLNGLLPR